MKTDNMTKTVLTSVSVDKLMIQTERKECADVTIALIKDFKHLCQRLELFKCECTPGFLQA